MEKILTLQTRQQRTDVVREGQSVDELLEAAV